MSQINLTHFYFDDKQIFHKQSTQNRPRSLACLFVCECGVPKIATDQILRKFTPILSRPPFKRRKQTNPAEAAEVSRGVLLHHHQSDFHQKQAEWETVKKRKIHDKCPLFIAENPAFVCSCECGVENYHKSQI